MQVTDGTYLITTSGTAAAAPKEPTAKRRATIRLKAKRSPQILVENISDFMRLVFAAIGDLFYSQKNDMTIKRLC